MAGYDGSIRIDTVIDVGGFQAGLNDMARLAQEAFTTLGSESAIGADALRTACETAAREAHAALLAAANTPDAENPGRAMIKNAAEGALANDALRHAASGQVQRAKNAAEQSAAQAGFPLVGGQMINGMTAGVNAGRSALIDAVVSAATAAYQAARRTLQIASPSRLFARGVGAHIPPGITSGIENAMPKAEKSVVAQMRAFVDSASAGVAGAQARLGMAYHSAPAMEAAATGSGAVVNLNQTVNTHDSLSPYELTRQAEDFLARARWKIQ